MKKLLFSTSVIVGLAVLLLGFKTPSTVNTDNSSTVNKVIISSNVQKVIDKSCFGCHNMETKNEKAKSKLMFESLDTLKVAKLVGKLTEISDEVREDKMPPKKFLQYNPEATLSPAEKDLLINWADSTANAYLE